jgi:hypothetical protein
MSATTERGKRREDVLLTAIDEPERPAEYIAMCLNYNRRAVLNDLLWLVDQGFLEEIETDGMSWWRPTERGRAYAVGLNEHEASEPSRNGQRDA